MKRLVATCRAGTASAGTSLFADDRTVWALGPKLQALALCDACRAYQKSLNGELYVIEEEIAA